MRTSLSVTAFASLLAASACVPERVIPVENQDPMTEPPNTTPPTTTPPNTTPPKNPDVTLTGLSVEPGSVNLEAGAREAMMAKASYSDGSNNFVVENLEWSSADQAVATIDATGWVTAVAEGSTQITVTHEGLSAVATVAVMAPGVQLDSVSLSETTLNLRDGQTASLILTASFSDATTEDVTASANWTTSDPSVVTVVAGQATVVGEGQATLQAEYLGMTAEASVTVAACSYPGSPNSPIQVGSTMPNLSWPDAYAADGSRFNFDLGQVHCGESLPNTSVILFVVGAGWCSACPQYFRTVNNQLDAFEAAGGKVVYMEVQDRNYNVGTSDFADSHVTGMVGAGKGIRVGDTSGRDIYNAPLVRAFPSAFVVRVRDMKILIDQASSNTVLPFVRIAQNPEGDWSNPNAPPFANNCGPGDEEASEPNDQISEAAPLNEGASSGGICTAGSDYYQVNMTGNWRLDVGFSHAVGDIDLFVIDESTGQPLRQNGQNVGATSGTDNEQLDWQGPALIRIFGYENASAPYTLNLAPR